MPYLVGPRDPRQSFVIRNLFAIACGAKGIERVNSIIQRFGLINFTYILFHYDNGDYSKYSWYDKVIHIIGPGQMKLWFAKRFLVPPLVQRYSYLFLWDEDPILPDDFSATGFLEVLDQNRVQICSPAYPNYGHPIVTPRFNSTGRWTSFVEVGFAIFSTNIWPCVWDLIESDLITGTGLDRFWGNCAPHQTAIIDAFPIRHASLSTWSKKWGGKSKREEIVFVQRLKERYHNIKLRNSRNPHVEYGKLEHGPKFSTTTLQNLWRTDPNPPPQMPKDLMFYSWEHMASYYKLKDRDKT